MSKLYAVTEGEYDKYCIMGLSSTKEGAERLLNMYATNHERLRIEEFDDVSDDGHEFWWHYTEFEHTELPDGSLLLYSLKPMPPEYGAKEEFVFLFRETNRFIGYIKAKDEQQAYERAQELKAQIKAEKKGD